MGDAVPEIFSEIVRLWEVVKSILAVLSLFGLSIAAVVAAAYAFFKHLGAKWIDRKFAEQLEAYKAEQGRELERLRHKINGVFDRTIRLHTKEFEVLPDLWGKLVEAHAWGTNFISPMQSYADLGRMDEEELNEFLAGTTFMEVQKRDIRDETRPHERQRVFTKIADLYRHNDAQERLRVFATSLRKDGIFVKPEIKADMDAMLSLLRNAIFEKRMNEDDDIRPRLRDDYKKFQAEAPGLIEKIEKAVADRLWESTTAEV